MTPPSRRDDPPNPFARHNPWGAPGPGVMRVGPPPASLPPKAAPPRPAVAARPITAPVLGARAGVLTGSAVPPPLPRAQTPQTQTSQTQAPQAQALQTQAPPAPAPTPVAVAEPAPTPTAPQPMAAAPPRTVERDWKRLVKARAPILAGAAYVVLVAASAVFLLPMRPEHDGGPEVEPAAKTPTLAQASATATQAPIRAAVATIKPAPVVASATPETRRAAQTPRPERRAVKLAAASPAPTPTPTPASPPEPEVQPLIVAQNPAPIVPPPLPERAPTVPPPTQDPDAPMVTRLPEMR